MKMCAALAATGADVTLYALKGREPLGKIHEIVVQEREAGLEAMRHRQLVLDDE